jgi:hypothetical protein
MFSNTVSLCSFNVREHRCVIQSRFPDVRFLESPTECHVQRNAKFGLSLEGPNKYCEQLRLRKETQEVITSWSGKSVKPIRWCSLYWTLSHHVSRGASLARRATLLQTTTAAFPLTRKYPSALPCSVTALQGLPNAWGSWCRTVATWLISRASQYCNIAREHVVA